MKVMCGFSSLSKSSGNGKEECLRGRRTRPWEAPKILMTTNGSPRGGEGRRFITSKTKKPGTRSSGSLTRNGKTIGKRKENIHVLVAHAFSHCDLFIYEVTVIPDCIVSKYLLCNDAC